ncbi:coiled-coil domain-containing protein 34-like [Anopheles stephensi]|uniref:Coiled-coil domain-containing protein n=1 Tax=Anopheles stephensi TaxID=30069 RepID=A0A182XZF9_ANOST|nr:coiled-coil domain-containing protein 34-like [Anopheles stephensi]
MDLPEATLELHSNNCAQKEDKGEESNGIKAVHVSTGWESQDSDTDDGEDNDCPALKNDVNETDLCRAFDLMTLNGTKQKAYGEHKKDEFPEDGCGENDDNDCSLLTHVSNDNHQPLSKIDDCDSSSDSSVTLVLCSEDEGEPQCFSTDRGGGDAGQNMDTDPRRQIIKVTVVHKGRDRDPEAYRKWLKAKNEEIRKNREKEMLQKQELHRQKALEAEQRELTNKKKIQEWMERKKQNCKKSSTKPAKDKPLDTSSEHLQCDPDTKYKKWLLKVRKQEEEKRLRDLTVKQLEQKIQQEKKKISEEIYQEWLKNAKYKPKPVPLNQGPNTLRGTVSKIFINPEPWKSNCE